MTPEREAYLRRQHADDITPKGCETCEVFAALDEARRERDGWKDIADRRYALRSEIEAALGIPHGPAETDSVEKAHARLRAILDERDALSAALAEVLPAANSWRLMCGLPPFTAAPAGPVRVDWQARALAAEAALSERSHLTHANGYAAGKASAASALASKDEHIDRLIEERDAARAEEQVTRARWQSSLVSLRTGTLERERDAALAREARLREAAAGIETVGGRGLTPESAAILNAALEVGPWPATATTWLADRERTAEERGARWGIEAASEAAPESEYFVQWPDPAEVCRAAREGKP